MYYPYLRGRQFELIALREYSKQNTLNNKIVPIIEPVKKTFNSLKLALTELNTNSNQFALVLNPQVGEIKEFSQIIDELQEQLDVSKVWMPTFIIKNNYRDVVKIIDDMDYNDVMLICSDSTDTTNSEFKSLLFLDKVKYIVSKENRTLKRLLRGKGKNIIRLDDNFMVQRRNKDYLDIPEEKFSEEHLYYKEDGYYGFSDYTLIESEFKEGGAPPYAVSIHLSYQKSNDEIWMRHFTSISNDDQANIQGKFAEATAKAVNFIDDNKIENNATIELKNYFDLKKYPGLGIVKKITIKNHLELVNKIIISAE